MKILASIVFSSALVAAQEDYAVDDTDTYNYVATTDSYEAYDYYPLDTGVANLDDQQAGFGAEQDASEDSTSDGDTSDDERSPADGTKAHHEIFESLNNIGSNNHNHNNNNNNNNNSGNKGNNRPNRPNRPNNNRPSNNKPAVQTQQNVQQHHQQNNQQQHVQQHHVQQHKEQLKDGGTGAYGASGSYNAAANNAGGNYNTGANGAYTGQTGGSYGAAGLKCWHCEADSYELCGQTGYEESCHANEETCELVVRERMGYIMQIHMGCKSENACKNNMAQNFQGDNPAYTQCRPETGSIHSVCRQCCNSDLCTKEPSWWYPSSRQEWSYSRR